MIKSRLDYLRLNNNVLDLSAEERRNKNYDYDNHLPTNWAHAIYYGLDPFALNRHRQAEVTGLLESLRLNPHR